MALTKLKRERLLTEKARNEKTIKNFLEHIKTLKKRNHDIRQELEKKDV